MISTRPILEALPSTLRRSEWAWVAAITVVGAVLRFYALDRLPPGLYHDEAYNGLDALAVLQGNLPIYFEANNGREPFFIYLAAGSVAFLGRSPFAIRVVATVLGTLTIPATYLLGRELGGRRVGIWSAVLVAGTFWTLNLSRVGFRAVALPLTSALALWLLARGLKRGTRRDLVIAGGLLGLSLYTYLAAPFGVAAVLLYLIYTRRISPPMVTARRLSALFGPLLLIALPLGIYHLTSGSTGLLRGLQVGIWNPDIHGGDPLGTFLGNLVGTLGMFVWRGEFIPRHNLPLRPVFDPLVGALLVIGVVLTLRQWRKPFRSGLPLVWTATMLLPTLLAENAPHFLRAVGVLPVMFLFPATGLEWLRERLSNRTSAAISQAALMSILAVSVAWTTFDYFARHMPSEAVYFNFESGATEMAARINRYLDTGWSGPGVSAGVRPPASGKEVLLDKRLWRDWASVRYLVPPSSGLRLVEQAEGQTSIAPNSLLVAWPFQDLFPLIHLLPVGSPLSFIEGAQERGDLEPEPRLLYVTVEAQAIASPSASLDVLLGESIRLRGYEIEPDAHGLAVRLFWEAVWPIGEDYIVFVHGLRDGQVETQADGPPALGYYPMSLWRQGEVVVDEHRLPISGSGIPHDLAVGLYTFETGERLTVTFQDGTVADAVVIPLDG